MESAKFIGLPKTHRGDTPLLVSAELVNPERTEYVLLAQESYKGGGLSWSSLKTDITRAPDANYILHVYEPKCAVYNGFVSSVLYSVSFILRNAWNESIVKFAESEPITLTHDYPQAAPVNVLLSYDEGTGTFSLTWSDENFARTGFDVEIQEDSGEWKTVLSAAKVWEYSFASTARRVRARVASRGIQNVSEWATTNFLDISPPEPEPVSVRMTLENVDILRLLPRFMRKDKAVIGLAAGVGLAAQELDKKIQAVANIAGAESITEDVLDALAEDRNIFWYDKTASKDKKLEIISTADAISIRLGTKWAVEKVLSIYFSETKIQEWFEYGGDPFHYKIVSADDSVIKYGLKKLDMLIGKIKRLSVRLDDMNAALDGENNLSGGVIVHEANLESITSGEE